MENEPMGSRRERPLRRTLLIQAVGVSVVIALVCGLVARTSAGGQATLGGSDSQMSLASQAPGEVAVFNSGDVAVDSGGSTEDTATVVDITGAQAIGAFSDYWTCVGMVGGQIAYWIITKQFWQVPPWMWPKVRQACWRFINS